MNQKIHLLSDLHTEFWKKGDIKSLLRPADILVLAGDIAVGRTNVSKVVKQFADHYEHVLYIPGNHEYYNGLGIDDFEPVNFPSNAVYLNQATKKIGDITFIGATLWTNFREDNLAEFHANRGIADFFRMKDVTPAKMKETFYKHYGYIKQMYELTQGKKVIVTHFMPAKECISPRWNLPQHDLLNAYFANDLGGWIEQLDDAVWLLGHTHDKVELTLGQTRLLARPLGYPGEHSDPYEHLILEY